MGIHHSFNKADAAAMPINKIEEVAFRL
jgi:hypothetical protein